jgi:hypothetical protein
MGRCVDRPFLRRPYRPRFPLLPRNLPRRLASSTSSLVVQSYWTNVHLQGGQGKEYRVEDAVQGCIEQALAVVVQGADRVLVVAIVSWNVFSFSRIGKVGPNFAVHLQHGHCLRNSLRKSCPV